MRIFVPLLSVKGEAVRTEEAERKKPVGNFVAFQAGRLLHHQGCNGKRPEWTCTSQCSSDECNRGDLVGHLALISKDCSTLYKSHCWSVSPKNAPSFMCFSSHPEAVKVRSIRLYSADKIERLHFLTPGEISSLVLVSQYL